jgi:hypothetical protein
LCDDGETRHDDHDVVVLVVLAAAVVALAAVAAAVVVVALAAAEPVARAHAHPQPTQKLAAVVVEDSFEEKDFVLVLALGSFSKRTTDFRRSTSHIQPVPPPF